MTPVIQAYQEILYYEQIPQMKTLLLSGVFGVVILVVGAVAFKHMERNFAEEM